MAKFEYAQLYTYLRDGFHTAAFISPEGRSEEWPAENYSTVHLNRAANDGWRVVNADAAEDGDASFLLERERRSSARVLV